MYQCNMKSVMKKQIMNIERDGPFEVSILRKLMDRSEQNYLSPEKYYIYIFCEILEEISSAISELKLLEKSNTRGRRGGFTLHLRRRLLEIYLTLNTDK